MYLHFLVLGSTIKAINLLERLPKRKVKEVEKREKKMIRNEENDKKKEKRRNKEKRRESWASLYHYEPH